MYLLSLRFDTYYGLCSGYSGGNIARRIAAQKHHFSTIWIAGRRKGHASNVSVVEVESVVNIDIRGEPKKRCEGAKNN